MSNEFLGGMDLTLSAGPNLFGSVGSGGARFSTVLVEKR
jgi:hypothetical protein